MSINFSPLGISNLISWSRPLTAKNGKWGCGSRTLTTPPTSARTYKSSNESQVSWYHWIKKYNIISRLLKIYTNWVSQISLDLASRQTALLSDTFLDSSFYQKSRSTSTYHTYITYKDRLQARSYIPFCSCTICSDCLSHKKTWPQSLPLTTYSLWGP